MTIKVENSDSRTSQIIIENNHHRITVLSFAATLHDWIVKDASSPFSIIMHPVALSDALSSNMHYGRFIGATAGRLFPPLIIEGKVIDLPAKGLLHGGPHGFSWQNFMITNSLSNDDIDELILSADNGPITAHITFTLIGDKLTITLDATTTKSSFVNFTYHPYFNLGNQTTIASHEMQLPAQAYVQLDKDYHVLGLSPLTDKMNFTTNRSILSTSHLMKGYDDYWLRDQGLSPIKLTDSMTKRSLIINSSLPYCVVYTHNVKAGILMDRNLSFHGGIAIEPQLEPYGLSKVSRPPALLEPNQSYHHYISYQFINGK